MRTVIVACATIAALELIGIYAGNDVAAVVAMVTLAFCLGCLWSTKDQ